MAPYASLYPALTSSADAGPVILTLGLGPGQDQEEHMMAVDSFEEEVVKEVQHYRDLVPMDVDKLRWEGPGGGEQAELTVVLDTNVLLSHLDLLRALIAALTAATSDPTSAPSPLTFIIPSILFLELDGLKSSKRTDSSSSGHTPVFTLARAATNWLLDALPLNNPKQEQPARWVIRGQRSTETLIPEGVDGRMSAEGTGGAGGNDSLILDAAAYFQTTSERVVLLSNDKNLRLRARNEGIEGMGVESEWRHEDLMDVLDGDWRQKVDLKAVRVAQGEGRRSKHAPQRSPQRSRPSSPEQHRRTSPVSPAQSVHAPTRRSPPHAPPSAAPSAPIPTDHASMDVDPASPPRPQAVRLPGAHQSPSSILQSTSNTFAQLIAKPLRSHLSTSSPALDPPPIVQWTGQDTVRALRSGWNEAGIDALCGRGVERRLHLARETRRADALIAKQLQSIKNSLSNLERIWDLDAISGANAWTAGRWEVVLEEVEEVLVVVLLGLFGGGQVAEGLAKEVRAIVNEWKDELRAVGVCIEA